MGVLFKVLDTFHDCRSNSSTIFSRIDASASAAAVAIGAAVVVVIHVALSHSRVDDDGVAFQ